MSGGKGKGRASAPQMGASRDNPNLLQSGKKLMMVKNGVVRQCKRIATT
jgi:hypothetical protein